MKKLDEELTKKHIYDFRVAYLENLLTPEEMSAVERHIQTCEECRTDLQNLKRWENTLRTHKSVMCPEPWELFDYVRSGEDPGGKLQAHLDECADCRSDAAAFSVEPHKQGVPSELWERIADFCAQPDEQHRSIGRETFLAKIAAWSNFFRIPVLAGSGIAVVVLLAVLLYPTGRSVQPLIGLSSVQWGVKLTGPGEPPPVPKAITHNKERLAIVILFKGFDKTPSQVQIDSLYLSLKPAAEKLERFNVLSPFEIKQTVAESHIGVLNRDGLFKILREKLAVNRIVLLTIHKHDATFDIEADLADATRVKPLRSLKVRNVSQAELPAKLVVTSLAVLRSR